MKKTKIVATLGPASSDVDTIVSLIENGANVFRFNFSHGDHEEHLGRMNAVREAEKITGKTVGFLLDTKGAEIRTTKQGTETGKIEFNAGDQLRIGMDATAEKLGSKEKILLLTKTFLTTFKSVATYFSMMVVLTCKSILRTMQLVN